MRIRKHFTYLFRLTFVLLMASSFNFATAQDEEEKPSLVLEGYVDTYYTLSSDSAAKRVDAVQKYTTIAPRVNQIGLNVARFKAVYTSSKVRSTVSLFWGDIPTYNWDANYPMIQEATFGAKLCKKVWFDMGFAPTHIGTELLLPKDNICSSLALGTQHEPFYMSFMSATWQATDKFSARFIYLNSYSNLVDKVGGARAGGLVLAYVPNDNFTFSYSNLLDNRGKIATNEKAIRFYNNAYMTYVRNKFTFQVGADYGMQSNTQKADGTTGDVWIVSGLMAAKYRFHTKGAVYGRLEYFHDEDNMINSGGFVESGFTFGGEFNPTPNSYMRVEGRFINAEDKYKVFLKSNGKDYTNQRIEALLTVGVYFDSGNVLERLKK